MRTWKEKPLERSPMPFAVLQNGEIRPLEPLPRDWQEGQRLRVETVDEGEATVEDINRDFALLANLCADSDPQEEATRRQSPSPRADSYDLELRQLRPDCAERVDPREEH